jgi:hypothetical protein
MKRMLPDSYFATQERLCEWFDEIRRASGCGDNADTGAVLRAVEAMSRKLETYEEQQSAVAKSRSYRYWGDYYNAVMSELPEAVPIAIPPKYNEVPAGWFSGKGKPSWDKCEKRLIKTHKVIRKALAYILECEVEEGEEWGEMMRADLYKRFIESRDPDEFEKECLELTYGIEEEDPETTWVEAVIWASGALEKTNALPLLAVEELLAYAEENKVEITKTHLGFIEESDYAINRWFDYLLTTSLRKTNRATAEEVVAITKLKTRALGLWKCYEEVSANDPNRPTMKRWVYDPSVSVAMLEVACSELDRLIKSGDTTTTVDWTNAIVEAVASVNDGNPLVVVEKTN